MSTQDSHLIDIAAQQDVRSERPSPPRGRDRWWFRSGAEDWEAVVALFGAVAVILGVFGFMSYLVTGEFRLPLELLGLPGPTA